MRAVHVVIAPDCFTGTLTATQAAEAMAAGWHDTAPGDSLRLLPLSDGGPGFLDVLGNALEGTTVALTVSDPLGREVGVRRGEVVVERYGVHSGRSSDMTTSDSKRSPVRSASRRTPSSTNPSER